MVHRDFHFSMGPNGIWQYSGNSEFELIENLEKDSDRAVAIIAASIVEARMDTVLMDCFTRDPEIEGRMFQPSGPLGSFSSKIDMIRLLGIISDEAHKELMRLKTVRNLFAHDLDIKDFCSQKVSDRVRNLKMIDTYVSEGDYSEKGKPVIIVKMPANKPFIWVLNFNKNKEDPRHRYLYTAQMFSNAFTGMNLHQLGQPAI